MNLDHTLGQVREWWDRYGGQVVLAGLVLSAVLVVLTFLAARRRGRSAKWLANMAYLAVLILSAEGMWVVARERLGLPAPLAACVFFVAEALMVSEATQASQLYARTTIRDTEGTVITPGHTGKHGRAVWAIAVVAGVIVATNSRSLTEFLLRLVLPLAVAMMWHNALTADGTSRQQGSWRWTPRRLLIAVGAITADAEDVDQINRDRHIRVMTRLARRVHHRRRPIEWWAARLERMALSADDGMIREVQERIRRAERIRDLTAPDAEPILLSKSVSIPPVVSEPARDEVGHVPVVVHVPSGGHVPEESVSDRPEVGQVSLGGHVPAEVEQVWSQVALPDVPAEPARSDPSVSDLSESLSTGTGRHRVDETAVLVKHGEALAAIYRESGTLTQYRVRQVTGVSARPSQRIRDAVVARVDRERGLRVIQ